MPVTIIDRPEPFFVENLSGVTLGPAVSRQQGMLNAKAINDAAASGIRLTAKEGTVLATDGQLLIPSNFSLIIPHFATRPTFLLRSGWWNSRNPINDRGPRASLFKATGAVGVHIEGLRVTGDGTFGTYTNVFDFTQSELIAHDNEIDGLASGQGFWLNSMVGKWYIGDNYIHDWLDGDVTWPVIIQSNGVSLDDTRVNGGQVSTPGRIQDNIIDGILKTTAFALLPTQQGSAADPLSGQQTDGIHIGGNGASLGHDISHNQINNVDEAIDNFGSGCTIGLNRIKNASSYALKVIHGAAFNNYYGNTIDGYGANAIVAVSYQGDQDAGTGVRTTGNRFSGTVISRGGYNRIPLSRTTDSAIRFATSAVAGSLAATLNTITGTTLKDNGAVQYGVLADAPSTGQTGASAPGNIIDGLTFLDAPAVARVRSDVNGSSYTATARIDGTATWVNNLT